MNHPLKNQLSSTNRVISNGPIMDSENVIWKAKEFIKNINLSKLSKQGITKQFHSNYWPGHTIVTYPFYENLRHLNDKNKILKKIISKKVESLSIYMHIPYCSGICSFCAYTRSNAQDKVRMKRYVDCLGKELTLWTKYFGDKLPAISSVYLGGGTPTALPIEILNNVLQTISNTLAIEQNGHLEWTCEVSPETIMDQEGLKKLVLLKEFGVNRISIGVQSFSDELLKGFNRRYNREEAILAIKTVQEFGFKDINVDLMYGFPKQNITSWIDSLQNASELNPSSITLYPLKIKRQSILSKQDVKNEPSNWSPENALLFAQAGKYFLEGSDYHQSNVYWYVKDDKHKFRQQDIKNKMGSLLGIGCSTYSFIDNSQFFNIPDEHKYVSEIEQGNLPISFGKHLSREELIKRFLIFSLRTGFSGIDFFQQFNADVTDLCPKITLLIEDKLIERKGVYYQLSEIGRLFSDEIGAYLGSQDKQSK